MYKFIPITLMIFILTIFSVSSFGQVASVEKMDVNFKEQTVESVFKQLSSKFKISILFNHEEVNKCKLITYKGTDQTLDEILNGCLKSTTLKHKFVDDYVVIAVKKAPQTTKPKDFTITGKVLDNEGNVLSGVTVIALGTTRGAISTENGEFKFMVPNSDAVIEFSYVGYKPFRSKVSETQSQYIVRLEKEVVAVDEVIVTGYANVNKKSFTGTSVHVTKDQLMKASPNNVLQSLQLFDPSFRAIPNNIDGSNPNALPEFTIRGRSGIGNTELNVGNISETELKNNPNQPTFILDGYEVSIEKVYDLDPSRVESITILKDAASTAIYGSRAANGVVVIETVAPMPGKIRVNYSFNGGLNIPDLSGYDLLNAREKLQLEVDAGGFFDTGKTETDKLLDEKRYLAKLSEVNRGVDTYWLSQPLRTSFNHKHNLTLSGGTNEFTYAIDLKLDETNGVMKKSSRDRKSAGVSLSYRFKNVMFKNYMEWSGVNEEDTPYGSFSAYARLNPYDTFLDENGEYKKKLTSWDGLISDRTNNPLYDANLGSYNTRKSNNITNNFNFKWFIIEGLRFEARAAISYEHKDGERFKDPRSSSFDRSSLDKKGELAVNNTNNSSWDLNGFLAYSKSFNKSHISATLGVNMKEQNTDLLSYSCSGFMAGNISNENFAANSVKPTGASSKTRLFGSFMSLNYTYNNIYLFDASGRMDGASQFGSDNKFAKFWSVGAGINISNYEAVKASAPWLTNLKIRGTYGVLGNSSFNQNLSKRMYNINFNSWYVDGLGATIDMLGNPSLTWETTNNLDLGLDLLIDNNYTLTLGYYEKTTKDLIGDISLPSSTGFRSYKSNLGVVKNSGIEANVRVNILNRKNIKLNVFGSISKNKNELKEISNALRSYNEQVNKHYENSDNKDAIQYSSILRYVEGGSLSAIYAMNSLGINPADGREAFLLKDGTVSYDWTSFDHVMCGDTEPDFSGTFGFNLDYKGIFMFAAFTYEYGGQMNNQTLYSQVENADLKNNVDRRVYTQRWRNSGDESAFKSLKNWKTTNTKITSRFVQDNNFIDFNSLTVGYTFPKQIINKWRMQNLKFQFSANNLGRIASIDTERGTSYPFARTINFSINVGF